MAEHPDRPGYSFNPGPPPEASRFLRNKGLKPSFSWEDVEPEEHAVAFAVAKMAEADMLAAAKAEVQKALDDGLTFASFQKSWRSNPALSGWWGRKTEIDPVTGEEVEVQLGSPRRLKTIYRANLSAARAAGQWDRIERTKRAMPFLLYQLGPSERRRPHHKAKAGLILPVDDPFWDEWMPPNGWGCKCWVRQLSRKEAESLEGQRSAPRVPEKDYRNSRTGEVTRVPEGIDPGWNRNPGKLRLRHMERLLADRLTEMPEVARRAALRDIATSWRVQRIMEGAPGKAPVALLPSSLVDRLETETGAVFFSSDTARKQSARHPELSPENYAELEKLIEAGEVRRDGRSLVFIGAGAKPWIAVIKRTGNGAELYLTTFYKGAGTRYISNLRARTEIVRE